MQLPLHVAISKGDKTFLKKAIGLVPSKLLESKDKLGRTPLILSVVLNKIECAIVLLKGGVRVDSCDNSGQTALHLAANKGLHHFVKLLLAYNATWQQKDYSGATALHMAAIQPNVKCLSFILKVLKPGQVDIQDSTKKTALHWCSAYLNTDHARLLFSRGANICIPDEEGKTPLHWAAANPDSHALGCVKFLLKKERKLINWQDYEGRSALHLAVATGSADIVYFLASWEGCNLDILDNAFCTPLHWAAKRGLKDKVDILLNKGASSTSADDSGATPLHYAAHNDHADTVAVFLSRHFIQDIGDALGKTAFMWAAARNAINVMKVMGAKMNCLVHVDKSGATALHDAASEGHLSAIEVLVNLGFPIDLVDKDGMTAFLRACRHGRVKAAKFLLDHDTNIHAVDKNGCSALHWCAVGGHAYLCQILIQRGALCKVNIQDIFGIVPLHCTTIFSDYISCVSVLLESDADPNIVDFQGMSPLHWAALSGRVGIARLLCEYNADVNALFLLDDWVTPLDCAVLKGNHEIIALLEGNGGLCGYKIRELAAVKIQMWYHQFMKKSGLVKRLGKCCKNWKYNNVAFVAKNDGVQNFGHFHNQSNVFVSGRKLKSSCYAFQRMKSLSPPGRGSDSSKIPIAVWRFSESGDDWMHGSVNDYSKSALYDAAAAVIQRAWGKYCVKKKFSRMRKKIEDSFKHEGSRNIAETLWHIKLKTFHNELLSAVETLNFV